MKNTRTRAIIILTTVILVIAVGLGLLSLRSRLEGPTAKAVVAGRGAAQIEAIPGDSSPTDAYVKLIEKQNVEQAKAAKRTGNSAIPTIVRSELYGKGKAPRELTGQQGVGFAALSRIQNGGGSKDIWVNSLSKSGCSPEAIRGARAAGLSVKDMREAGCTPEQLLAAGYNLSELLAAGATCPELRKAGFTAEKLRAAGKTPEELRACGFSACELKAAGFTAAEMRKAGYTVGELQGAGFSPDEIGAARGFGSYSREQVENMGCSPAAIRRAIEAGVSPEVIRTVAGCSASDLRAAGLSADELKAAGFSASDLKEAGYSARELKNAGYDPKDLKNAGYSPTEMRQAGLSADDLKKAGLSPRELRDAGFTATELKNAGLTPKDLVGAGFSARDMIQAGVTPQELREAGLTARQLLDAGVTPKDLQDAGYTVEQLRQAGLTDSDMIAAGVDMTKEESELTPEQQRQARLNRILQEQAKRVSAQRLRQEIQQRQSIMSARANAYMASWGTFSSQTYVAGIDRKEEMAREQAIRAANGDKKDEVPQATVIRPGDILFGVMDTGINSDEPGPVLATIVAGRYKGARLIGTLELPDQGEKVVVTFNTMTLPSVDQAVPINAVAIDPRTARTALSTRTDKHTLARYGSLFASSFLEGLGQAFQQKGTTVTAGAGGGTTVSVGARTFKDNAFIALGKVGQRFSQVLGQTFNRRPTVFVKSGTSVGVLFTTEAKVPIDIVSNTRKNQETVGRIFG